MATIEPLNSVMTYQAQGTSKPQVVTSVNTEVPEDGQTVNVDETTASVTRPQPEDDKSGGEPTAVRECGRECEAGEHQAGPAAKVRAA